MPVEYKIEGVNLSEAPSHNHVSDPIKNEFKKAIFNIVDAAASSSNPPRKIISNTIIDLSTEEQSKIFTRKSILPKI